MIFWISKIFDTIRYWVEISAIFTSNNIETISYQNSIQYFSIFFVINIKAMCMLDIFRYLSKNIENQFLSIFFDINIERYWKKPNCIISIAVFRYFLQYFSIFFDVYRIFRYCSIFLSKPQYRIKIISISISTSIHVSNRIVSKI